MPEFASFDQQGAGWSQSASLMDRAATQRRAEYEFQQKQIEDQIMAPVNAAKQAAALSKFNNDLEGDKQAHEMFGMANNDMPGLRKEWNDSLAEPDAKMRMQSQRQILSRAARYSSVVGIGDEIKTWATAHTSDSTYQHNLDLLNDRITAREESDLLKQQMAEAANEFKAKESALLRNQQIELEKARQEGMNARALTQTQKLVDARKRAADAGDAEGVAFYDAQLKKNSNVPAARQFEIQNLIELMNQAIVDNNPENEAIYRARIDKLNKVAPTLAETVAALQGGGGRNPAPPPAPAPQGRGRAGVGGGRAGVAPTPLPENPNDASTKALGDAMFGP